MQSSRKSLPDILSSLEKDQLLNQPNKKVMTGLRNFCMITLMLKYGLRVSEIRNLQVSDINYQEITVRIEESGGALGRVLWLRKEDLDYLQKWLNERKQNSLYLFISLNGSRIKDRYIREMVKRLAGKAGIRKDVHPYLLRHTFAIDLLRETGDIKLLKAALGHRDISTTMFYKHYMNEKQSVDGYLCESQKRFGTPVDYGSDSMQGYLSWAPGPKEDKKLLETPEEALRENYSEYVLEPAIEMSPEDNPGEIVRIPPIKCSNCDYILRYQSSCPKCKESFSNILKHWGRKY